MASCGAILISDRFLLTAAHCVDQAITVKVVLGAHNIRAEERDQQTFIVGPRGIVLHEQYTANSLHDIALLKLPERVYLNARIQPIELPIYFTRVNEQFDGMEATVSGWGVDEVFVQAPLLRYTQGEIISNAACKQVYHRYIFPSHICVSGVHGSFCDGDSGGPLVASVEPTRRILIGIASFTSIWGCGVGPHVYTRVTR